jgi:hypothetical protein
MRLKGRLLVCMAVLAGASQLAPPALAQQAPAPLPGPVATKAIGLDDNDTKPARTPKEGGARITGRFARDDVLDLATQKIRKDAAGRCDTVKAAADGGANNVAIVCDGGTHAYFMQRGATEWTYVAPPLIASKNRPPGAK